MAKVVIAVGSNLGNRIKNLQIASGTLASLSNGAICKSSVYETAPVGKADVPFLNAVALIETDLAPSELIKELKKQEAIMGRDANAPRWSNRLIDFDIIVYDDLIFKNSNLEIPHPEFTNRLFVLIPMADIDARIEDPRTHVTVASLIEKAPKMDIFKTALKW